MSAEDQIQQAGSAQWQVISLRLTAFPVSTLEVPANGWWASLAGEEPEIRQHKPKTHELQEIGTYKLGRLIVAANPARFDLQLHPLPISQEGFGSPPTLGSLVESLAVFMPVAAHWLQENDADLQRMAFGAEVFLPADNEEEALRQLSPFIPLTIDPDTTSDLLYQINRRRHSKVVPDLLVNRLSKWAVVKFSFGAQIDAQSFDLPGLEQFVTYLELDINTSPKFWGVLSHNMLDMAFKELVEMGQEITEKGDTP